MNSEQKRRGEKAIVCAHEKRGSGEGGTTNEEETIVYLGNARTVEWYTRKRKGETGDLGQRSRESKWIMIGFNQISTTNKIFPRTPQPFYHPHISLLAHLSMENPSSTIW